jgi:hypothetical protein
MDKMNVIFVLFALGSVFAAAEFVQLVRNLVDGYTLPVIVAAAVGALALIAALASRRRRRRPLRPDLPKLLTNQVFRPDTYLYSLQKRVRERKDDIMWGGS